MILEETVNKFMRDIINLVLDIPDYAIKAKQNAPRPSTPYASVDFVTEVSAGYEEITFVDAAAPSTKLEYTASGARELTLSLKFLKANAIDYSRRVRIGLVRESVQSLFWSAGLGLGVRSPVREISFAIEDVWEEMSQFDVTLNSVSTDEELIESIGRLEIAGQMQTRNEEYDFEITIEETS